MSKATMVIEGFAAEPKQRVSQSGKRMVDVSVAHTPRRFNKQSNQWEDVTGQDGQKITTWARATFFEEKADAVAETVGKGTLVRLEGEPRLNVYTNNSGHAAASIDLQFADISVVVQATQAAQAGSNAGSQPQWASAPPAQENAPGGGFAGNDPWAETSPF